MKVETMNRDNEIMPSDLFSGPPLSLLSEADRGLFLFEGDPEMTALVPLMAGWRLVLGERVLFLDGDNRFDPYPIVALAKRLGKEPKAFLASILISRAFTCHQMAALILRELPKGIARHRPKLAIVCAPMATFYDEAVPLIETRNLLTRTTEGLERLAKEIQIAILSPDPPVNVGKRARLPALLREKADRIFSVRRTNGIFSIAEAPSGSSTPAVPT
jgi:hypothetical protein